MKNTQFEFEPIRRIGINPAKINNAEINAHNLRRANLRDDNAELHGYGNAVTEDNIRNYNGEWRSAPLDYREPKNVVTRGHKEIKSHAVKKTKIQLFEELFK